jgi:hypothetical protein
VDNRLPEGQRIHEFLLARAKALAGKYIDFDETPVTFVLSDSDQPNAFFADAPDPNPENRPRRDEYQTVRAIKNPLKTRVICITRGLIEMIDNLDQLDFVLGHELTHMIMRSGGIKRNSKGEEEIADLHAVDLMYDAGSDPKQAMVISEKISAYAEQQRKKHSKIRYRNREEKEEERGVNWSAIFDVHMTHENRKTGIEASLTRLSHLIDDKTPTTIDKSTFDAHYNDPVDAFLKANDYENKRPLGKLKLLADCIDNLAKPVPAEEYFQAEMAALPEKISSEKDPFGEREHWIIREKRERLQKAIDAGCTNYFNGPVLDKKYQQKIANLAEGVLSQTRIDNADKPKHERESTNTQNLNIYLQNKAYKHITENGYPKAGDINYLDSAGVIYTYFYCLFVNNSPDRNRYQEEKEAPQKLTRIETDINQAKERIKAAKTAEQFTQAVEQLNKLNATLHDIRKTSYGYENRLDKLDDLSSISDHETGRYREEGQMYDRVSGSVAVPWNNLVEIAKTDENTKAAVVKFLQQNNIEDFRITHDLPYIRIGRYDCYKVDDKGQVSGQKIEEYELDFVVHRDVVLQAYDYIRTFFDNETSLIEETCAAALNFKDEDFAEIATTTDSFNRYSFASKRMYDFVSMFNALPADKKKDEKLTYEEERATALALIPDRYRQDHLVPGSNVVKSTYGENVRFQLSTDLFQFRNPVFQEHLGADFQEKLTARKQAQQQQMFDTAFALVKKATDMYLETKPKLEELNEKANQLHQEMWGTRDDKTREDKKSELETVEKQLNIQKRKKEDSDIIVRNLMRSIFKSDDRHWFHLQRLTPEQKKMLAEFAARDEKGVIMELFEANGYEHFCDYLGILDAQTERVLAGDFELTDAMRGIATKYGYQHATTKEALSGFAREHDGKQYNRDNRKYAWYMHAIDTIQYLGKTSEIDVHALAITLTEIEQPDSSCRGEDPKDLVQARHANYKKFITKSNILPLATRAIVDQRNYNGLSCDDLLKTADSLIKMRRKIAEAIKDRSGDNHHRAPKPQMPPEQEKFLRGTYETVRSLVRKSENQALKKDNALEKARDLYNIYCSKKQNSSDHNPRQNYIVGRSERLKRISALSEKDTFWPPDVLEHAKAFVYAKNSFLDDRELENKILNNILDKLETLPYGKQKKECFHILLDKNLRAAYPETRERLFDIYARDVSEKLGKDDRSARYQKRLAVYLKALNDKEDKDDRHYRRQQSWHGGLLSSSIASADKYLLLRKLSDSIVSQEQTSQMMKEACHVTLNSENMARSYLHGIGVDYLTEEMDRDPELAKKFVQFFNSKGERENCDELSDYIAVKMKKKYPGHDNKERLDTILKSTKPSNCRILYENFWSAPLQARAVITSRILKSAVHTDDESQKKAQESWERVFDVVMDNLIHPEDTSTEARYARDVMHSYIKSRSDYERVLILSAMMVANRNIGSDAGNVGKALKLFLENMGPAEIKLGQAISSHPNTPPKIKKELKKLKSTADMPARWTVYDWIRAENIPEELWKDVHLGDIMGSASYYTSIALGDNEVLRILRPEAREKAAKGFRVIGVTIDDLKQKQSTSDLDYGELTSSTLEMVTQAARMSYIETDHDIGEKQCANARNIYNGVKITSGGETFSFKVMDWRVKGQNWIVMRRAKGQTFNDLPEDTPEQIIYKKKFAKAYVAFEIANIFSGKKFDHDKHGAQLSIDPETNEVGIYDTGAMAIDDPKPEEQRLLGNIIYDFIKGAMNGEGFTSFGRIIDKRIDELYKNGLDTQYLVEVKKGLLALEDFFDVFAEKNEKYPNKYKKKTLNLDDMKDILSSINLSTDVTKAVHQGLTEKMSALEKVQFQAFQTMKSARSQGGITIHRDRSRINAPMNVANVNTAPTIQNKSSWLEGAFRKADDTADGPPEKPSFIYGSDSLQQEHAFALA